MIDIIGEKNFMSKNKYDILGVSKTASQEEIKKAYRVLSKKYHPDNNPNNEEARNKFDEVQEAYDTLGNPDKRKQYDIELENEGSKSNLFNTSFGKNIFDYENIFYTEEEKRKFAKAKEEYIKFLDEMELKIKKYGYSLKGERQRALNTTWSLLNIYSDFDKFKIKDEIASLLRFEKAKEEYIKFLDEMEPKFKKYGYSLKEERERTLNTRWSTTNLFWDTNTFNRFKIKCELESLERFDKWRQDYIELLDRLEPEFNRYNRSSKKEKSRVLEIPYSEALEKSILHFTVKDAKVKLELEALQKKAKAERDNPAFIQKLEQCRNEVEKRNLNFQEYLKKEKLMKRQYH